MRVNEGRPQLYGTQIAEMRGDRPMPWPIEDAGNVDARRGEMDLAPLTEYLDQLRRAWRPREGG